MNLILEVNTEGTDYYIGDLHGCYALFERLLVHINFDFEKDRIISVGDLVDRGPNSLDCLRLLQEPWFYAVMANHEDMMVQSYLDPTSGNDWLWFENGGRWALSAFGSHKTENYWDDEHFEIKQLVLEYAQNLPKIISVKQATGDYIHVIHAEFHEGARVTDALLIDPIYLQKLYEVGLNLRSGTHAWQWGRTRFYQFYGNEIKPEDVPILEQDLSKIQTSIGSSESLVISGHTILKQPIQLNNFLNIDTGAFLADRNEKHGLTCYNSSSGKFITVRKNSIDKIECIIL